MPLFETLRAIHEYTRDRQNAYHANNQKLLLRLADVVSRTWDLGFTAFGGPPVHFQILHQRFVEGRGGLTPWIDEQTYQELFAVCQALPGPASTKMVFCMALIHAGFIPAVLVFLLWSLPGAIGMFGLSLGVQHISSVLPGAVYALLSGLNASTVGIVALAAVQLAEKAIKDRLSRILVIFGACAGLCYNALWYFPVLIVAGGIVTAIWDVWLRQQIVRLRRKWRERRSPPRPTEAGANEAGDSIELRPPQSSISSGLQRRAGGTVVSAASPAETAQSKSTETGPSAPMETVTPSTDMRSHGISIRAGLVIIAVFFASFIAILTTRGLLDSPPRPLDLFANMYLAGTIIFGGGPVVIPLLREYVVEPGWVSSRDFLIGLAIIQAFPGPNFNFGVFLGALALLGTSQPTIVGALVGYVGIFLPGITLAVGVQSLWRVLRTKPVFVSFLRGINATAVGLVFTAVYRLWEIGYLTQEESQGQSLAKEPWWVVVAVLTYAESAWFNLPPAPAIVLGGALGLAWYGALVGHARSPLMSPKERTGERSGERSAACATCGKTFARSDTLLRHEKSHLATEDRGPVHRVTNGTFRACRACATARSRCSGGTPCGRCSIRNIECIYPNKRRKGLSPNEPIKIKDDGPKRQLLGLFNELVFPSESQVQVSSDDRQSDRKSSTSTAFPQSMAHGAPKESYTHSTFQPDYSSRHVPLSQSDQTTVEINAMNHPTRQMMPQDHFGSGPVASHYNPDFVGATSTYDYTSFDEPLNWIPPSIYPSPYDAELEQDFSFILPPLSDTPNLGPDYGVAIPLGTTTQIYQVPTNVSHEMPENQGFPASLMTVEQSPASSASDGINATKPTNSTSTASDFRRKKRKTSLVADMFNKARKQRMGYSFPDPSDPSSAISAPDTPEYCSQTTYDSILNMFRKLCVESAPSNSFESPAFPNMNSFNACIDLYFEYFHANYPLLHKASFGPRTHWISVLAVAAIGSTFTRTPYALDIREAFQEFLRRAVDQYADGTPDVSLDIPLAQARILNLIGLVQSDRDQLRCLAPRYHADLSRWCLESGVLQLPECGDVSEADLDGQGIEDPRQYWQRWIRVESVRRVGYLTWMLDCCLGYMANVRPLCNMDDARTPLPCSESAWSASSPECWAEATQKLSETPSLCAALEILYNKKTVDPAYSELSQTLLIHALYQRTWEVGTHIKQPLSEWVPTGKARGFLNTPTKDNFWLPLYPLYANWRNSACDCLDVLHWQASSIVAKASGVEHGVILHLHLARIILLTPFQEIQDLLFSLIGKVGNSSKASFYVHDGSYQPRNSAKLPQIRKITWRWLREDQHKARLAMVHAGSVFWYVRRYSATSFFEPVAVYLATLVLWTYGSYKSAALERDAAAANQKPEGGPSGPDAGAAIQPSRMERKEHPVLFINNAASHPEKSSGPLNQPHSASMSPLEGQPTDSQWTSASGSGNPPPQNADSDSEESTSSSDEQPEFIHLDRPCDDEMVQHFVRNGHNMSGHMSNVGDICKTPQKVLLEGAKLLRTRLACWGVSREYYDILTKLAELRKAS
ncbi:uncharacterized protein Z518_04252 [Rhinocladiella mackenziei CBS 650.93]|uniref:C2H2-type domain-containing protein n=1 Tax=Rhinocladiella mackenziei CBS 650.93 TaxID=1442369 RepID=A0A0D2FVT9_9EURO|nr:uncharacterized protein Z518_04252 [Rhinocladiella mackenziei CBS 650.93]KIX06277.1 hypothetical protein Z518_04252 [Rhinocladiella mackenziei CBS 650.93]